ncbi:MAG: signal peptidase I [Brotaphodocola sp.]
MSKKRYKNAADVIRERRISLNTRQGYISLLSRVAVFIAAIYLMFTQVFLITQNKGMEMFPAMKDGDLVIAYRLQRDYAKDDVVVYEIDGIEKMGRIIALENDAVMINDGIITVNGITQGGEILYPTYVKEEIEYPYKILENQVFILGDYRTNAKDSRDYGAIPVDEVKGKVITILRRREL